MRGMAAALEHIQNPPSPANRASRTPVFIVCSARPGAGKTFLARLILGFQLAENRAVRAYDLNPQEMALIHHAPQQTQPADIDETRSQMTLFDDLVANDGVVKIVDLDHALLKKFFTLAEQIGFFEAVRFSTIEPVLLFATDLHPASPAAYRSLQERFPQTILVPVENDAIARFGKYRDMYPTLRAAAVPIRIPVLAPPLRAIVDSHNYSFAELRDTLPMDIPLDICFELRSWTKRAFLELRELELRLLLARLQHSLGGMG